MSTRVRKTMCATSSKKRMLYIAKKAACKENLLYSGTIPNRSYSKSIFTFIRWKHVRYRWPKPRIPHHHRSRFISEFTNNWNSFWCFLEGQFGWSNMHCLRQPTIVSPQPSNWGGTKARLALWINPSLGLAGNSAGNVGWIGWENTHLKIYIYI